MRPYSIDFPRKVSKPMSEETYYSVSRQGCPLETEEAPRSCANQKNRAEAWRVSCMNTQLNLPKWSKNIQMPPYLNVVSTGEKLINQWLSTHNVPSLAKEQLTLKKKTRSSQSATERVQSSDVNIGIKSGDWSSKPSIFRWDRCAGFDQCSFPAWQ